MSTSEGIHGNEIKPGKESINFSFGQQIPDTPVAMNASGGIEVTKNDQGEIENMRGEVSGSVAAAKAPVGLFVTAGMEKNSESNKQYLNVSPFTYGMTFGLYYVVDMQVTMGARLEHKTKK